MMIEFLIWAGWFLGAIGLAAAVGGLLEWLGLDDWWPL